MPLAIGWSLAILTGQAFLDLDTMIRTHGELERAGRPARRGRLRSPARGGTPMKVLIAGGSGLIGTALANALIEAGHEPVILSRARSRPGRLRRRPIRP